MCRQANDTDIQETAKQQSGDGSGQIKGPYRNEKLGRHSAAVYASWRNADKMLFMEQAKNQGLTGVVGTSEGASVEQKFSNSIGIMARLRAPGGCPWDRQQTFESLRRFTLEESYEVVDAIERKDWQGLKDELGDLLLQVLFYAEMAKEANLFTLSDVLDNLNQKMVRRHPHVFGDAADVTTPEDVLKNWEEIKSQERTQSGVTASLSLLDSIPRGLPALMEASKLGSKASSVGFDWVEADQVFSKLEEEIEELRQAMQLDGETKEKEERQQEELGDILFTTVNLARKLEMQAEMVLRGSNAKFRRRFQQMESLAGKGSQLSSLSPTELEEIWESAKHNEREGNQ